MTWRSTARLVATAAAASVVSRAAGSVRRLLAEASAPPELAGPVSTPEPPTFLEPPVRLTASGAQDVTPEVDHMIAAQSDPPHEFGPAPVVVPSRGIGFRSEPRRLEPVAEMPVISRPAGQEPDEPERAAETVVVIPEGVHTAASIVRDLDEDPEIPDDDDEDADVEDEDTDADTDADDGLAEEADPAPAHEAATTQEDVELTDEDRPADDTSDDAGSERPDEAAVEPAPLRALRLTAPPVEDTPIDAEDAAPLVEPVDELLEPVEDTPDEVEVAPVPAMKPETKDKEPRKARSRKRNRKGKHRRHTSAISGTIVSTRGRGVRGVSIAVLDDREKVVASALTGNGGSFVIEELPAGSYRLTATDDVDGDFADGWHGGRSLAKAAVLKVKAGKTRRKADVTLVSTAAIDLDVDLRKKKAVVEIRVIEAATGTPAGGAVRVSTKLFSTELVLAKGRANITLRGSAKSSPALSKKLDVDYLGTKHTQPGSASAKLR